MTKRCPECGATLKDDQNCQAIFEQCLALEFSDTAYGSVHMLTVACFMIQHGRYSAAALTWIARRLDDFLNKGISIELIRHQAAHDVKHEKRDWNMLRGAEEAPQPNIAWSMTIADVDSKVQDGESYCELIRQWARVTLRELTFF